MNKWKEVWIKRTLPEGGNILDRLIRADGFDGGAGKIEVNSWKEYVAFVAEKICIKKGESIFEVGCGGGAFLYLFYKMGHRVGGIDYSKSLIEIAKDIMEDMDFQVSEAISFDTEKKYDLAISNGVFHYFPDLEYAESVVKKMLDKTNKTVAILEIPDLELKEESKQARRGALPIGEYEEKYNGLDHLYYEKNWFYALSKKYDCRASIFDQNIKNYGNNRFRFNCIMKKL